jgi:hypothetical protein
MLVHDASKSTMKLSKKWPQEDDNTGEASEAQAQREDPVQSARRGRRTAADPTDTPIDASSAAGTDVPFQPAHPTDTPIDASSAAGTDVPFQPACRATSNCTHVGCRRRRIRIPAELPSPVPTHVGANATGHGPDTARPRRDDTHAPAAAAAAGALRGAD